MTPRDPLPTRATLRAARGCTAEDLRGMDLAAWTRYAPEQLRGQSRPPDRPRLVREVVPPCKLSWSERIGAWIVVVAFLVGFAAVMARIKAGDMHASRQRRPENQVPAVVKDAEQSRGNPDRRDSADVGAGFRIVASPHGVVP